MALENDPLALSRAVERVKTGLRKIMAPSSDILSKTADYTANPGEWLNLDATSGNIVVTLPAASGNKGRAIQVRRTDASANTVTVQRAGSDTIDGATSFTLAQWDNVLLVSDGSSEWMKMDG